MRHRHGLRKLNRTSSHRLAMLRNMTVSLLRHEAIKTTLPKAKELRRVIEPILTLGKIDTLANKRLAFNRLRDREMVRQAVRRTRPALRHPQRRLPAHPEDGLPPRRQCADGLRRTAGSPGAGRGGKRRNRRISGSAAVVAQKARPCLAFLFGAWARSLDIKAVAFHILPIHAAHAGHVKAIYVTYSLCVKARCSGVAHGGA